MRYKNCLIILLLFSCTKPKENEYNQKCDLEVDLRFFEFKIIGLNDSFNFLAATSNPDLISKIEEELRLPFDQRINHINGIVAAGNGCYNGKLDWHYMPNQWSLSEVSIELCDGYPSNPVDNSNVGETYNACPWNARLLKEIK